MKVIIVGLVCLVALCRAIETNDAIVNRTLNNVLGEISFKILPDELISKLQAHFEADDLSDEASQVLINDYVDKIFANLQQSIRDKNLNDVAIPDAHLALEPTGHIDLTQGQLHHLDTISRNDDVILKYEKENKKIIISLSIKFDELDFNYHYHTVALLISISGGVEGSVKSIKVNADISFDFTSYTAFLDHYDMKDTGTVSVTFTGNKIVDWLTNAMSSVVTTFLGQVIVNVVAKAIRENLRDFVEQINETIAKIIKP